MESIGLLTTYIFPLTAPSGLHYWCDIFLRRSSCFLIFISDIIGVLARFLCLFPIFALRPPADSILDAPQRPHFELDGYCHSVLNNQMICEHDCKYICIVSSGTTSLTTHVLGIKAADIFIGFGK